MSRAAATMKAAEEGSPGTTTSEASISAGPSTPATRVPAVVGTLNSGSMSSVWLREGAGSVTVVVPSAKVPARSTAVFSWAEAMGLAYSMARRRRVPCTVMGRCSGDSGSKVAPIFASGATMRRMGRFCRLASPVMVTAMSHGATTPMSRRAVVPELPQSMGAAGWLGPSAPQPVTVPASVPSGCRSSATVAPRASTARMEARTSSESSTPVRCEVPSAMAAKSTARCEMDLSPGTWQAPASGPPKGSIVV